MLAVEREPRRGVLGDAERGRREARDGVARRALATAARGELAPVRIGVARRARRERELAEALRDRPRRRMALRAADRMVLAGERVAGLAVVVAAHRLGQTDPLDLGVAGLAARSELREVDRPVAGLAPPAARRWPVVAAVVAGLARDAGVAVGERQPRMVRAHPLAAARPAAGVVARGAWPGRELTAVRIGVACLAGGEPDWLPARRRARVALLAGDGLVLAGERESRERVVELAAIERRPHGRAVALLALGGEPAGVGILVAACARTCGGDELRLVLRRRLGVALETGDLGVTAVERPAGERVIEPVHRAARPADQLGVAAEVLDVTFLARPGSVLPAVQAAALCDLAAEVLVTIQAQPRDDLVARLVAARAIVIAVDARVRLRQRSRRQDLRGGGTRCDRSDDDEPPLHPKIQR